MACFFCAKKRVEFEKDLFVLVPGLRIPSKNNLFVGLSDHVSGRTIDKLIALRKQLTSVIEDPSNGNKKKKKPPKNYSGFPDPKILYKQAEEYLSIILGLIGEDCKVIDSIDFSWLNMEDKDKNETELGNTYYEVVSVLQILSMALFLKANESILKTYTPKFPLVVEKSARDEAMNYFNQNYELLNISIQTIFSRIDDQTLNSFPLDVSKNTFMSLKHQARGYALELELIKYLEGDNEDIKENLVVKKNLACEMFYCWKNAHTMLDERKLGSVWGEKHQSFLNWKLKASQSIAYLFYGLHLDSGDDNTNEHNCHAIAVACLKRSMNLLKLVQDIQTEYTAHNPTSKPPINWNAIEFLKEIIPKTALRIERVNTEVYRNEKVPEDPPNLPQVESFVFSKTSWNFPPLHPDWS